VSQTQYSHISDNELLEHYQADKDNRWLGILLQRYTLLLFGVCMKYLKNEEEARDAVQQIFLKALTEIPKYRIDYFKSWLYTIARNHCLMKLRDRHKQMVEIHDNLLLTEDENENSRLFHILKDQQFTLMKEALSQLTAEQKNCISLFYLEKQTYQQIAEKTGFNYMQVKSYIQNGKRNLKILLQKSITENDR
jgi:RNA polymerase sigma factor (sigma-70 family)